jgi:hypothetical protein
MNVNRKIQLTAAAVISNGVLALGLMSASPAFATTCNSKIVCAPTCDVDIEFAYCSQAAPPGCTFSSAVCLNRNCVLGGFNAQQVLCRYH